MADHTNIASIRVWREPGYDHGRTGAWMLDWPGCFAWGPTRDGAMARVQSAVGQHVRWLASHGEDAVRPATGGSADRSRTRVPKWGGDGIMGMCPSR